MIRLFIFLSGLLSAYPVYCDQLPLHVSGIILPDANGSYTAEQVLHWYQQNEKNTFPDASQVKVPVNWIVSELNNPDNDTEWVVNLSSALIDYVDLYIFENGQLLEHHRTGNAVDKIQTLFSTHYGYIFELNIPPQSHWHILIRTKTEYYYNIGAWAQPAKEFWQYSNSNTIIMVLATGMIAGLILYNLFLAFRITDSSYLWYSLHALAYLLYFINNHSYYSGITPYLTGLLGGSHLFIDNSKVIYLIDSFLMIAIQLFSALFCYHFLKIAEISTLLKRVFQFYLSVVILQVLLFPFVPLVDFALFNGIWILVLTPLVLSSSLLAVLKKISQAAYMMIGWTIMLFSNGISLLELMGKLDYSLYTALRSTVAIAVEMLIFSLALADRVRTLIDDKAVAEQTSLAKSEFLATMSHEIRTPLYGVLGTTQLLAQTELNSQQQDYLKSIDYSGQALLAVIDEILDYSKLEADAVTLENKDFDLRSLLYSLIVLLHGRADEKGLDLACTIDDRINNRLRGDSNRIRQILLNLLGNAVKFTDKGSVSLSVDLVEAIDQRVTLKFSVTDSGIGIKPSQRVHIFSYFTQADSSITRRFGGTGMGLAIAKKLVERMNGTIGFTSEPEVGSCFFFIITLLVENQEKEIAKDLKKETESSLQTAEKIRCFNFLIVDDSDINRAITKDLLHFEGHNVTATENGEQALTLLSRQNFDVVLMDIRMPVIDGIAVTKLLRERQDNTPVIGFTASVMPDEQALYLASGMNAVLLKPLDLSALNQILADLFSISDNEYDILQQHRQKLGTKKLLGLLSKYHKESQKHLDSIETAIQKNDYLSVKEHAHLLAGMAGSMGFFEVNQLAGKLEKIAPESDRNEMAKCLADLQKCYLKSRNSVDSKLILE